MDNAWSAILTPAQWDLCHAEELALTPMTASLLIILVLLFVGSYLIWGLWDGLIAAVAVVLIGLLLWLTAALALGAF